MIPIAPYGDFGLRHVPGFGFGGPWDNLKHFGENWKVKVLEG